MRRADRLRRAAWVVAAVLAGLTACDFDSSVLGCSGLAGDELAKCEYYNRCLGQSGDDLTRCLAAGAGGAGGESGSPQGGGGAPMMGAAGLGGGGSGGNGGLVCTAPEALCGDACKNVQTDVEHCGVCGYACGAGSTCSQGACSAVAIVSGVVSPYAFALDAMSLYFVVPVEGPGDMVPPAVQKVPRAGGAASPVFAGVFFRSRSLALMGDTLFFGDLDNNGVIRKGPLDGSGVVVHLANQPAVQQLVVADGRLWWATFDGNSRLRRVAATGTPAAAEELLPGPTNTQFGRVPTLAAEGAGAAATVFWLNVGGSVTTDKGLWRKVGASAPAKLVPGGAMTALALSNDKVFVADATAGIAQVAKGATAPVALTTVVKAADVGGAAQGLAVAGDKLYWLAFNAGQLEIHRAVLDGSEARVLGRVAAKSATYWGAPIGPAQLAVDGGFVYFSDPGTVTEINALDPTLSNAKGAADGAIYRLPE